MPFLYRLKRQFFAFESLPHPPLYLKRRCCGVAGNIHTNGPRFISVRVCVCIKFRRGGGGSGLLLTWNPRRRHQTRKQPPLSSASYAIYESIISEAYECIVGTGDGGYSGRGNNNRAVRKKIEKLRVVTPAANCEYLSQFFLQKGVWVPLLEATRTRPFTRNRGRRGWGEGENFFAITENPCYYNYTSLSESLG